MTMTPRLKRLNAEPRNYLVCVLFEYATHNLRAVVWFNASRHPQPWRHSIKSDLNLPLVPLSWSPECRHILFVCVCVCVCVCTDLIRMLTCVCVSGKADKMTRWCDEVCVFVGGAAGLVAHTAGELDDFPLLCFVEMCPTIKSWPRVGGRERLKWPLHYHGIHVLML